MKRLLLFCIFAISISFAGAQTIKTSDVPLIVRQNFAKRYFGVTPIRWEKMAGDYAAILKFNKLTSSALYDSKGNFKALSQEVSKTLLPKMASDYCTKNYPGYSLSKVSKIVNTQGVVNYAAEMTKGSEIMKLIFDSKGLFVKKG